MRWPRKSTCQNHNSRRRPLQVLRGNFARLAHENLLVRHATGVIDHLDHFLNEIVGAAVESQHWNPNGFPIQKPELDGCNAAILKGRLGEMSKSAKRGANLFVMGGAVERPVYLDEDITI
jgi:hypothetical protein